MAIPPVPPIHPSRRRLDQGNNYLSAAASSNAAQTVYPTPKPPNLFPQKCDHFRGSQAIHRNRFLQLARSLFVSFVVSFVGSCGSRNYIVIACADHWFYCNRVVRFAEVVAVAVRDLTESLQLLHAIAAGSSWLLVRAHGIVAIASAICGIPRGHILRLTEFIAIAFCEVADT